MAEREVQISKDMDKVMRQNMEKCAAFVARMIEKYGKEVLEEIEEEKRLSQQSDSN